MRPTFFFIVITIMNPSVIPGFRRTGSTRPDWNSNGFSSHCAGFLSEALKKRTNSLQTDVIWRHRYAMPVVQALWRRSDRGGCLLWLAAPAVALVTTGGAAGERGLAAVVASPVRLPNWRYSPIYIVMYQCGCFKDMISWYCVPSNVSFYAFHQPYPSDNSFYEMHILAFVLWLVSP